MPGAASAAHVVAGITKQAAAAKAKRDEATHDPTTFIVGASLVALVALAAFYVFRRK